MNRRTGLSLNFACGTLTIIVTAALFLVQALNNHRDEAFQRQREATELTLRLLQENAPPSATGKKAATDSILANSRVAALVAEVFGGFVVIYAGDRPVAAAGLGGRDPGPLPPEIRQALHQRKGPVSEEATILGTPSFLAATFIHGSRGEVIGTVLTGDSREESLVPHRKQKMEIIVGAVIIWIVFAGFTAALARERSMHEEELRRSEEKYRSLFEDSSQALFLITDRYVDCNEEACRLLGVSRQEILGARPEDFSPPTQPDGTNSAEAAELIRTAMAGSRTTFPWRHHRGDGRLVDTEVTLKRVIIGGTAMLETRVRDVTAQRQAAEERREMQRRLREQLSFLQILIDTIPSPIFYKDREGHYLGCNRHFEDYLGISRDRIIGRTVYEISPDFLAETYHRMDTELITRGGNQTYEAPVRGADGVIRHVVYCKATFPAEDGSTGGLVGVMLDVTERKRIEEAVRRSEEEYRTVFETGTAMVIIEEDARIARANSECARITGVPKEELEGMRWQDFVHPDDRERLLAFHHARRLDPDSTPSTYEFRLVDRSGTVRDILTNVAMIRGSNRSVAAYLDISEQKRVQRLLDAEKGILERIVRGEALRTTLDALCIRFEEQAPGALCSILLSDEENRNLRVAAAPSLPAEFSAAVDGTRIGEGIGSCGTAAATAKPAIVEDITISPLWEKYRKLPLTYSLRACWSIPVISSKNEVLGTFAVYFRTPRLPEQHERELLERGAHLASIVVERKRASEALRKTKLQQQAILDNIPDLVWLKDTESRYLIVNRAASLASGRSQEEVVGKTPFDLWPRELATQYREYDLKVMEEGRQVVVDELISYADGTSHWFETVKMPVRDENGVVIGTTGIARNIEERRAAAEALRESEERFHQIFSQNGDALLLARAEDGRVMEANAAMETLTGHSRSALLGMPLSALFSRLEESGEGGDGSGWGVLQRGICLRNDGSSIDVSVWTKILLLQGEEVLYCSVRDISEKLRLEEEVRQSHAKLIHANKMTSLGMLASGIAHEINNPNSYISVNAAMLEDIWRDAAPVLRSQREEHGDFLLGGLPFEEMEPHVARLLRAIAEGSSRITAIITGMADFVSPDSVERKPEDVNRIVRDALAIIRHRIRKYTEVFTVELAEELPPVRANRQQIEQVVINLVINALQALPAKERGVRVTTGWDRKEGLVRITVTDEGRGMPAEVLGRLAEPFFTTRINDGGTGLGLYISSSMVKDHGGSLYFSSVPGEGTSATVSLPAVPEGAGGVPADSPRQDLPAT